MTERQHRNLVLLARAEAILGGMLALAVFAVTGLDFAAAPAVLLTSAGLGIAAAAYFLTAHQLLKRWRLDVSTLILTAISTANIIAVVLATGGLDSPYYSLWLLAITLSGMFGLYYTIGALAATIGYFIYNLALADNIVSYTADHAALLIMTAIAALAGEWLHSRDRVNTEQSFELEAAKGQIGQEQFKAQALMSAVAEGVVVIDGKRHIQLFNKSAAELTGWDVKSTIGMDYSWVIKLENADTTPLIPENDPFAKAWNNRRTVVSEDLILITRANKKIGLRLTVSPMIDDSGRNTGLVVLFRDISQEKAIDRQKDEFISTASHEMRTPVAAIEGYISLALNPKSATIDDRARKYLENAHTSIGHLGHLFQDLLSVTKAEHGMAQETLEPVDINELLVSAVADMQFTATSKKLKLSYQTSPTRIRSLTPNFLVAANPERLREVVMNLIDNAIKYTPEGAVTVLLGGDDKSVTVTVSDTGLGIAATDIPHLFQKFYRVDSSQTRTIGGTGLGLFLCRRVIELYNGRIWVESKVGQGSNFIFSLPRLSEVEAARLLQQSAKTVAPAAANGLPPALAPAPTPAASTTPATPAAPAPAPASASAPAITPVAPQIVNEVN